LSLKAPPLAAGIFYLFAGEVTQIVDIDGACERGGGGEFVQ
jgi:hypothetical protein